MDLGTILALSLGPAIAKAILKVWLKDKELLGSIADSIVDLISSKTSDVFERKKAERQFQEIGDSVAQSLLPLFDGEGSGLDENGKTAVALAVAQTFEKTPFTATLILEQRLDPVALAQFLISSQPTATTGFSERETALYERLLTETSRCIVDVATELPAFTEKTFAELIKKGDLLIETTNRILAEVKRIRQGSENSNIAQDGARFETEYRLAVGKKLDELELFGVDLNSNANRRHRLSVAYVTLSVRRETESNPSTEKNDGDDGEEFFSVDVALIKSKRLVIRGQAGSGKTTLLQWIAVKSATRAFEEPLTDWNDYTPFFIRLRDCVEKGLPKPEDFPALVAPSVSGLMPTGWVHQKLKSGKAIILVDGVDEMREAQRSDVRSWLKEMCVTFSDVRIIVSSRPSAIEDGWMDAESFDDAELQSMGLSDIYSFVDHWHSAVREQVQGEREIQELIEMRDRLKTVLRNTPGIRNLATNPLLCAMLCALNRDRRQNLPSDRIELYEACCQMLAERRDKERKVSLQDYPQLNYRQKKLLLEDLAYWFMSNGWSVVARDRGEERLGKRLAHMTGLPPHLSNKDVMRLFIERTGLLREPQPAKVDFTHRTFQEFLAAQAALDEGDVGVLINQGHDDQWREMIVLAAGRASPKVRGELILGLIKRGDDDPENRHRLHLLAVSCLETSVELAPDVISQVKVRLRQLVPPTSVSEAWALSSAVDLAVPYLRKNTGWISAVNAAACVRALGFISTPAAAEALEAYAIDWRQTVFRALLKAWDHFDREEFAERILAKRDDMDFDRLNSLEFFEHFVALERLVIRDCWGLIDLTPISRLPKLRSLRLYRCSHLSSLGPLNLLTSLVEVCFWQANMIKDLSPLTELPNLKTIYFDNLPNGINIPESLKQKVRAQHPFG